MVWCGGVFIVFYLFARAKWHSLLTYFEGLIFLISVIANLWFIADVGCND